MPSRSRQRKHKKRKKKSFLEVEVSLGGVSLAQKALFAKHLSVMLKAGLPVTEALSIARESATGKLKKVTGKVLESTEAGSSLSASFAHHGRIFPAVFVSAIKAGEASGTLVENLENVAQELRKEKELVAKIRGAMLYPMIILVATFALGMALSFLILPKITPLFEGLRRELPWSTRALIWFSHLVQDYGRYLFLAIVGSAAFFVWLVRQRFTRPVTHLLLLKVPILKKITRSANLARFSRSLAMLFRSGINIDEALEITKEAVGNYYYQRALQEVGRGVRQGTKLSINLTRFESLFPKMVTGMVRVGEQSGKFEETFFYLADFYETEVDTATKSLSTAIEPILLLIIGSLVGFLALSIITPIYDISSGIR